MARRGTVLRFSHTAAARLIWEPSDAEQVASFRIRVVITYFSTPHALWFCLGWGAVEGLRRCVLYGATRGSIVRISKGLANGKLFSRQQQVRRGNACASWCGDIQMLHGLFICWQRFFSFQSHNTLGTCTALTLSKAAPTQMKAAPKRFLVVSNAILEDSVIVGLSPRKYSASSGSVALASAYQRWVGQTSLGGTVFQREIS